MSNNNRNYFVADDNGNVIAHDCTRAEAEATCAVMQEREPDAGWEVLTEDQM